MLMWAEWIGWSCFNPRCVFGYLVALEEARNSAHPSRVHTYIHYIYAGNMWSSCHLTIFKITFQHEDRQPQNIRLSSAWDSTYRQSLYCALAVYNRYCATLCAMRIQNSHFFSPNLRSPLLWGEIDWREWLSLAQSCCKTPRLEFRPAGRRN